MFFLKELCYGVEFNCPIQRKCTECLQHKQTYGKKPNLVILNTMLNKGSMCSLNKLENYHFYQQFIDNIDPI